MRSIEQRLKDQPRSEDARYLWWTLDDTEDPIKIQIAPVPRDRRALLTDLGELLGEMFSLEEAREELADLEPFEEAAPLREFLRACGSSPHFRVEYFAWRSRALTPGELFERLGEDDKARLGDAGFIGGWEFDWSGVGTGHVLMLAIVRVDHVDEPLRAFALPPPERDLRREMDALLRKADCPGELREVIGRGPVDLNAPLPDNGFTPLEFALLRDRPRSAELLLEFGADERRFAVFSDRTAAELAASAGAEACVRVCLRARPAEDLQGLLGCAASGGLERVVLELLQAGASADRPDRHGTFPIAMAAKGSRASPAVVERLLAAGAEARLEQDGTPLTHAAVASGAPFEVVEALLDAGASIDARDSAGQTLLHIVADRDHALAIRRLIVRGARLDVRDNAGRTPLELALANPSSRHGRHFLSSPDGPWRKGEARRGSG